MKKIKNIIIDLGGVVIDLDRDRCVREFERLGLAEANRMLGLYKQEKPFLDIETGEMSPGEFFDDIRRRIGKGVSDSEIEDAFFAFLVNLPVERLRMLREWRDKGYRLFMLSNTNAVMYNGWIRRKFACDGFRVEDYFDGIVTSFGEGVCKPNPRVFEAVLRRYDLNPAETVMLDDSEKNCLAAKSVGMQAIRIQGENGLKEALNSIDADSNA